MVRIFANIRVRVAANSSRRVILISVITGVNAKRVAGPHELSVMRFATRVLIAQSVAFKARVDIYFRSRVVLPYTRDC